MARDFVPLIFSCFILELCEAASSDIYHSRKVRGLILSTDSQERGAHKR